MSGGFVESEDPASVLPSSRGEPSRSPLTSAKESQGHEGTARTQLPYMNSAHIFKAHLITHVRTEVFDTPHLNVFCQPIFCMRVLCHLNTTAPSKTRFAMVSNVSLKIKRGVNQVIVCT